MKELVKRLRLISGLVFILLAMPAKAEWFKRSIEVMGTQANFEFEWPESAEAAALMDRLSAEMQRIDQQMSPFKPNSELSSLNLNAALQPQLVSSELFELLQKALHFSKITQGAFDISFSSLGYLYDYRQQTKPSEQQIKTLRDAINYRNIHLDADKATVFFSDARVKIDLGGIAKGHAVDRCIEILRQAGVKHAYVSAGGDSRLLGSRQERLWYMGIRHPRDEGRLIANLPLENMAVSTSGDYERFFIENGVRYHHIIDPKTGQSARESQSVTILANDSTTADALSTSIFILGVEKGMALVNQMAEVSAIIVDKNGRLFISEDLSSAE